MLKSIGLALVISGALYGIATSADGKIGQVPPRAGEKLDSWVVAGIVGMVIGSEEVCGHVYDRESIDAFVSANVDPDDEEFAKLLEQSIEGGEFLFRGMKGQKQKSCDEWRERASRFGIE